MTDDSGGAESGETIEMNRTIEETEKETDGPLIPERGPESPEQNVFEEMIDHDTAISDETAPLNNEQGPVPAEKDSESSSDEVVLDNEKEFMDGQAQKEPRTEGPEDIEDSKDTIAEENGEAEALVVSEEEREALPEFMFIRELVEIQSGHNDENPVWSRDGRMIAFERGTTDKKEIIIAGPDGVIIEKIYFQLSSNKGEIDFFFPGIMEDISYNSGISWSPAGDRFVFMSNGGSGNYDLYLRELGKDLTTRLTEHEEKDGHAQWSPNSDRIVFVSGRKGKGDLYIMDLATKRDARITRGEKSYLYPQWSPDGERIAMIYGSNENHDIYMIGDLSRPFESVRPLTTWEHDDLRPVWSPNGKKIAFYSNYNPDNDPKIWSLVVIDADGSGPSGGEALAARVVARDVIPDIERGPAWMPDSNRMIYVKNDRHSYNPIYMVTVSDKTNVLLETGTKMNHDVVCSRDGTIAFRAQVRQWDHIYIAKLKE